MIRVGNRLAQQRAYDKLLWQALVAPDRLTAVTSARRWLDRTPQEKIEYRDHRLLAGISRRFGKSVELQAYAELIQRIERQLWARAAASLTQFMPLMEALSSMHMPHLLHGNIYWHGQGNPLLNDLERIEVLVPNEGLAFATKTFWAQGWMPGEEITTVFAPDPVLLSRPGFAHILLRTDNSLIQNGFSPRGIWGHVQRVQALGQHVPVATHSVMKALVEIDSHTASKELQTAVNLMEMERRLAGGL